VCYQCPAGVTSRWCLWRFFFKKKERVRTNEVCNMYKEWMSYEERKNERKQRWRNASNFFYFIVFFYRGTTQLANEPHRDAAPLPTFVEVRSLHIEWTYCVLFSVKVKTSLYTSCRNRGCGRVAPLTLNLCIRWRRVVTITPRPL